MIGRRSIVGLTLLSAFLFSAFMASSAFAAFEPTTNTTAFTCVEGGGKLDYSDPHCDNKVTPPSKFGHVEITPKTSTPIEITNAATGPETKSAVEATLEAVIAGNNTKITATTVSGTGTIENVEPAAGQMQVKGKLNISYTGLTVNNPAGCEVEGGVIKLKEVEFEGVKEGENMGLLFKPVPAAGGVFAEFKLINGACGAGLLIVVKGTAIGTAGGGVGGASRPTANGSGATTVFEPGNGMESLKIGAAEAKFKSTTTTRMKIETGKPNNPIALTTT